MNIESYVFAICFLLLFIFNMYFMMKWLNSERELDKKKILIKILQRELVYARGDAENEMSAGSEINENEECL